MQKGDVVLVEDVDRVTRKGSRTFYNALGEVVDDKEAFIVLTAPRHAGFEINRENYESDWNLRVGNAVSSEEGKKRMERGRNGLDRMKAKLRAGQWAKVANRPWWILSDSEKQCFTVDEVRANIVREIFRLYNNGLSYQKIAKKMEGYGVPPGKSKNWSMHAVRRMLGQKAVLGYFNEAEENVKLYPAIVTEDVFWAVQKKKRERQTFSGPERNGSINLLKSLAYCAECNNHMRKTIQLAAYCPECGSFNVKFFAGGWRCTKKSCGVVGENVKRKYKVAYYKCGGIEKNICDTRGVRMDLMEESLRMMLSKSEVLLQFIEAGTMPSPIKLDTLKSKLADVRKKEEKLARIITNDETPSQVLLKSLKEVEAEGRRLSIEIDREEATIRAASPTLAMLKDAFESKLMEKWDDNDARLQIRELLRSIIERVVINKQTKCYVVHWKDDIAEPIEVKLGRQEYEINGVKFSHGAKDVRIRSH